MTIVRSTPSRAAEKTSGSETMSRWRYSPAPLSNASEREYEISALVSSAIGSHHSLPWLTHDDSTGWVAPSLPTHSVTVMAMRVWEALAAKSIFVASRPTYGGSDQYDSNSIVHLPGAAPV